MATKRKDKSRVVLKTGEVQRKDGTYQFSWQDSQMKRRFVYARTLDDLREKEKRIQKDKCDGTLYHFGVLTSNVHMAWMRAVCGRLKSDYRYSKEIVYNTFPWPKPTEEQRIKIEQTAQVILNAREQYSDCSLADMYGEKMYLFPELVKAHQDNDRAVMQAYGFTKGREAYKSEAACVAELMKLYQKKVEELEKR